MLTILGLLFFLISAGNLSADTYYYYVDPDGTVHVTDEPPEVRRFNVVKFNEREAFRQAVRTLLSRNQLRELIDELAQKNGLDPRLVEAFVKAESEYDPMAVSKKGAKGLMQLMPQTAETLGVQDPHDPRENLQGGIRHLRTLLEKYQWNLDLAAAAYNAGEAAVKRYGGIPPYAETVDYVRKVRKYWERLRDRPSQTISRHVNSDTTEPRFP